MNYQRNQPDNVEKQKKNRLTNKQNNQITTNKQQATIEHTHTHTLSNTLMQRDEHFCMNNELGNK